MRREVKLSTVLLIYVLGLAAGAQIALFLYDTFDDGVSDPISGAIALVFFGLGVLLIARVVFRPSGGE